MESLNVAHGCVYFTLTKVRLLGALMKKMLALV